MSEHHSHEHEHHHEEENETPVWQIIVDAVLCAVGIIFEKLNFSFGGKSFLGTDIKELIVTGIFLCSYLLAGRSILHEAVENIFHGAIFDENFLMGVASVGAICLGEFPEACGIVILYQIGEHFEDYALDKSRGTIEALTKMRPEHALLKKGDEVISVKPEEVKIGDIIEVRPGERIPLDGVVIKGESFLDTSALTGESVPRKVNTGDEVMSGSINRQGVLEIRTTKLSGESTYSRILKLVEESTEKKTRQEQFVTRFARIYTPVVCLASLLVALIPSLVTKNPSVCIYRALMFLVVSCPCAIVISIPLSFYSGITACGKIGLLVKGSTYLESLSKTKVAVFDKTGTLTKGTFTVTDIHAVNKKYSPDELLAIAAHAERYSNHPISESLKAAHESLHKDCCKNLKIENASELTSRGIKVKIDGKEILAGNMKLMNEFNVSAEECPEHQNGTIIHVAVDGEYFGHIVINDEIKEDSCDAVSALKKAGVSKTVMLTGDSKKSAEHIAKKIGLDEVHAELLSGDKVLEVEKLLGDGTLIFVGDGINDAPVLARADVGIGMGGVGSDAAVEAADIIIMDDKTSNIARGIKISRKTMRIVYENLIGSLGIKVAILVLSALGLSSMWLAVFADVGVTMLAVMNSLRLLGERGE